MKHILLIATGGTIASENSENGLTPQISSEELLSYVPAAREFCTIDAVQILNIDSTAGALAADGAHRPRKL